MGNCLNCGTILPAEFRRYCSNQCQSDKLYCDFIARWKLGLEDGNRGVSAKNISGHLYKYLRHKYKDTCSICGWNKVSPVTGKVPLEINHIDGNADNNHEDNLRILCPNCHSLTPNYKNLNYGKGREWRRLKYMKS